MFIQLISAAVFMSSLSFASPAPLTEIEKDKILFMIFEDQNKKISHQAVKACKKLPKQTWECSNLTAKNFLMNLLRAKSAHSFQLKTEMECEAITPELQKGIESSQQAYYGPLEFRREVKQSLKGQWLCRLQAQQQLPGGPEAFDDKAIFSPTTDGNYKLQSGLSFIMNRDKNRIVSRKFAAWTAPSPESKN